MGTLSARKVKALIETTGRHFDGDNLYLIVKRAGSGSWMLRAQWDGKRRDLGLGSAKTLSLKDARIKAAEYRSLISQGTDPRAAKKAAQQKTASIPTFKEAAEQAHADFRGNWQNEKHVAQWLTTLDTYAFALIGHIPVDQVDASHVISVLNPIWLKIPETASRVRQRIGSVLDWAFAHGHRTAEAPTRAVSKGLKKQTGLKGHFAALPYTEIPPLMAKLATASSIGRMALRFTILTAARSGEVRGATWGEIDLVSKRWTIPAARMKMRKEHVVPLSAAAIAVLSEIRAGRPVGPSEIIFPGNSANPMSNMTMSKALHGATDASATVHGFRSGFRDWAAENDHAPNDVVEAALAHTPVSKTVAAYLRTNHLSNRAPLMERWAAFSTGQPAQPTDLHTGPALPVPVDR